MKTKLIVALLWGAFSFTNQAYAINVNHAFLDTGETLSLLDTTDGQKAFTKGEVVAIANLKNHTVIVMRSDADGFHRAAGIAIDNRHILTVDHITSDTGRNYYLSSENAAPIWATVGKRDASHDLALLEIDKAAPDLVAVPLPLAKTIALDDPVYTVGHPNGELYQLTTGRIESFHGKGYEGINCIQLDMRIRSGNSGGFAINPQGKMVGMMFSAQDMVGNMTFMIGIDDIISFIGS